jgi:Fur family ferric uptake transcriptional regulator
MGDRHRYAERLQRSGLGHTELRETVLAIVGDSPHPLTAGEIVAAVRHERHMDKVTCYRILDLLVQHGVVARLSSADRAFRYGLAEKEERARHPHFFCVKCGEISCLDPVKLNLDIEDFQRSRGCTVQRVEVRLDGICSKCKEFDG